MKKSVLVLGLIALFLTSCGEKKKEEVQKQFLQDLSGEEVDKTSMELKKITDDIEKKTERWFELGAKAEA